MEEGAIEELIDPRLDNRYLEPEVICLMHAASLCIRRDPHSRPRMSQAPGILPHHLPELHVESLYLLSDATLLKR
ncbi:hypothetical protein SOVF_110420 isoform A [Spinacia oleracea]|nr:hypothetical protein SOVF_110420 isoform A [Spinacia oleracea]